MEFDVVEIGAGDHLGPNNKTFPRREFRVTGSQSQPTTRPDVCHPDISGFDDSHFSDLIYVSADAGLDLDLVSDNELIEIEEWSTMCGPVSRKDRVAGLTGQRCPFHVPGPAFQRLPINTLKHNLVDVDLRYPNESERLSCPGRGFVEESHAIGCLLRDFLARSHKFGRIDHFTGPHVLAGEAAAQLIMSLGLHAVVDEVSPEDLPTQIPEDEYTTPNERPTENLNTSPHHEKAKAAWVLIQEKRHLPDQPGSRLSMKAVIPSVASSVIMISVRPP